MRIGVFIDGNNMYYLSMRLRDQIDYKKIIAFFSKKGDVVLKYFFTASPKIPSKSQKAFWDVLRRIGFNIEKRIIKVIETDDGKKFKGDMDAAIGFAIADLQYHYDALVLFSGDSDYYDIVTSIAERGKTVFIISIAEMAASEFVDTEHENIHYIDIRDLMDEIEREKMLC